MSNYLKVMMEDGYEFFIETIETGGHLHDSSIYEGGDIPAMSPETVKQKVVEANELLGKALPAVTGFARGMAEQIHNDIPSDEMELEFSIALNAEAKVAICSGGLETCFKIKLKWKNEGASRRIEDKQAR